MAARITKLTPEQESQLETYREKWLQVGLSTGPTDRARAEDAVRRAYAEAKLAPPRIVVWLRSPLEGCIGAAYLRALDQAIRAQSAKAGGAQVWDQVGAQVWDQVWDQVRGQVWDQVGDQVGAQVRGQVWDQVGAQVRDQVGAQVRGQVWAQVWDQVGAQVRGQVWAQVRGQVWAQVWDQVWDQVRGQVWDQVGGQVWDQVGDLLYRAGYGLHDANWLGFYEYFDKICGIVEARRLAPLNDLAEVAGWWWPFAGAVILTEKPSRLERNERGQLHGVTGPAVGYSDGWGVFAVNGVRVPRQVIESPETLTVQQIETERNAEVRRVMIERFGMERFLRESGAEELHRDEFGVLYRKQLQGDEPLVMVTVKNSTPEPDGSIKDYFLRVHPELRPLLGGQRMGPPQELTARNAVASTFGLAGDEYAPARET